MGGRDGSGSWTCVVAQLRCAVLLWSFCSYETSGTNAQNPFSTGAQARQQQPARALAVLPCASRIHGSSATNVDVQSTLSLRPRWVDEGPPPPGPQARRPHPACLHAPWSMYVFHPIPSHPIPRLIPPSYPIPVPSHKPNARLSPPTTPLGQANSTHENQPLARAEAGTCRWGLDETGDRRRFPGAGLSIIPRDPSLMRARRAGPCHSSSLTGAPPVREAKFTDEVRCGVPWPRRRAALVLVPCTYCVRARPGSRAAGEL